MEKTMHKPDAEALYREFFPKVSAYVGSRIYNRHDAEELVSSILFKAIRKLDSFDPEKASLSTWVYTITRNTVTDFFRTRKNAVEYADYMDLDGLPHLSSDGALENLADALVRLPERERDLIVLHYYKGYTLKTVADMMGMSYSNIKLVHKKALAGLRLYLGDH